MVKARSATEVIQLASESDLDVVLADYHLGDGINGMELLRRLQPSQDATPAAALITADHRPEVAIIAGAAGYPCCTSHGVRQRCAPS